MFLKLESSLIKIHDIIVPIGTAHPTLENPNWSLKYVNIVLMKTWYFFFGKLGVLCGEKWHHCEINQFLMFLVKHFILFVKFWIKNGNNGFRCGANAILSHKIQRRGMSGGGLIGDSKVLSGSLLWVSAGRHNEK